MFLMECERMNFMEKKIGIGVSDFKALIDKDCYYIDKTILVKEIYSSGPQVILFPRPRRFGKTLNLSMLRYFFEKTEIEHSYLFENLQIWKHEEYREKQGKYPVIFLTLKDVKQSNWEECFNKIKDIMSQEFSKHDYLLKTLKEKERQEFEQIVAKTANKGDYESSLRKLAMYLERYHKQKVIILMDEYDTPIQAGYINGYYDKIIDFMRSFLSEVLKDNVTIEKAVLTGILRVAKESIFSGLNNLEVSTILGYQSNDKFGLEEFEVENMLKAYGIEDKLTEVKDWYNGYKFGGTTIYNPWSIINFVSKYREGLKPYWVNTSSNDLIKSLITKGGEDVKQEMEELIQGKSITKAVNDSIVFGEIEQNADTLWNFLLFSGYLKAENLRREDIKMYAELSIPNKEIEYLYKEIIMNWFNDSIYSKKLEMMLKALTMGDIETFEDIFSEFIDKSMSYFDVSGQNPENFYHAFVLGLLVSLQNSYQVKSNKESGYGRYDIMLIPKDKTKMGVIIEFKKVNKKRGESLETACEKALKQIEEKEYKQELLDMGIDRVMKLGISFEGKKFLIKR